MPAVLSHTVELLDRSLNSLQVPWQKPRVPLLLQVLVYHFGDLLRALTVMTEACDILPEDQHRILRCREVLQLSGSEGRM